MIIQDFDGARRRIEQLLDNPPAAVAGDFTRVVSGVLDRRAEFLASAAHASTPSYLYDGRGFREALTHFARTFDSQLPRHSPYYAVKSNHHPLVVAEAVRAGFGLDVSSGRELRQALALPHCPILFSGPAKSEDDLTLAVTHADRVTIHLDSFGELARLGPISERLGRTVRAGVRIYTPHHGAWSKFGIPLDQLGAIWRAARAHPNVLLQGIQFHLSWNRDPRPYQAILADLAARIASDLTAEERSGIAFIDVGGGYRPQGLEGSFPFDHPVGALARIADEHNGVETNYQLPYLAKPSVPLEEYAIAIGASIREHLAPLVDCAYYTEPGRIVSTFAMHILLRVVDKKRADLVILDGGINMVGWERYSQIYCPVVNLTRPSLSEQVITLGGALCDCEDLWGYRCYAEAVEEGDLLLVPYQGAYTFCVAQSFIRDIPGVFEMPPWSPQKNPPK